MNLFPIEEYVHVLSTILYETWAVFAITALLVPVAHLLTAVNLIVNNQQGLASYELPFGEGKAIATRIEGIKPLFNAFIYGKYISVNSFQVHHVNSLENCECP